MTANTTPRESVSLDDVSKIPMFDGLSAEVIEGVRSASVVVRFARNAVIALEGQEAPPVYFVLKGLVHGYRTGVDGRAQTLARLHPGDPFYLPCVLGQDRRAPVSARAMRPSSLLRISCEEMRELLRLHPSLALAAVTELSNKMSHFVRLAGDLGVLCVRARLARLLLELAEGCDPPTFHGTQEDLAAAVGSVREVVSRHLHELSEMGMVRVARNQVQIVNIHRLRHETGR